MSPAISPVAPSPTLPLSSRRPSVSFGGFGLSLHSAPFLSLITGSGFPVVRTDIRLLRLGSWPTTITSSADEYPMASWLTSCDGLPFGARALDITSRVFMRRPSCTISAVWTALTRGLLMITSMETPSEWSPLTWRAILRTPLSVSGRSSSLVYSALLRSAATPCLSTYRSMSNRLLGDGADRPPSLCLLVQFHAEVYVGKGRLSTNGSGGYLCLRTSQKYGIIVSA